MSRKNPNIIRIEDEVKIIIPNFFIRCGYPLSFQEAEEIIKKEYRKEIIAFLNSFSFTRINDFLPLDHAIDNLKCFKKIVSSLAYDYINSKNFGGCERKIYTKEFSKYKNMIMVVDDIKFVKTGNYTMGSKYHSYDNEYDYDPPELREQKTHKLIHVHSKKIRSIFNFKMNEYEVLDSTCSSWIEVINVEKIFGDKNV